MGHILVIDDEPYIRDLLKEHFSELGHEIETSPTIKDGLHIGGSRSFDVIFLDVNLPDGNGIQALPELRIGPGKPEIIIMTGYGDPDGAELAVKNGAWDYLEKPVSIDHFTLSLQRAFRFREQARASEGLVFLERGDFIGESPQIKECLLQVARAAPTRANVLITGETGTGKELIANLIHTNSPRSTRPFVVVDCASLPEFLLESILFGHEKGAFTGADRKKPGLLAQAHQGTLFLDEIGELPMSMQKSLLRALEEHRFRPVGGIQVQESDFRLLAATNRNLEAMVENGTFRQDLLFRLKTFTITLPALRHRQSDIKPLAIYHANRLCRQLGVDEKGFSQDFFQVFEEYNWPGNVRELANTMELALAQALNQPILFAYHLPTEIRVKSIRSRVAGHVSMVPTDDVRPLEDNYDARPASDHVPAFRDYRQDELDRIEKEYLQLLLAKVEGNHGEALRISGLARTRLYTLLKKHGLKLKS